MKKHSQLIVSIILVLVVFLSACGNNTPATATATQAAVDTSVSVANTETATAAPASTNTPDPCAPENIGDEVQKVHKYMREFDDASSLAASRPREQLADAISELQKIRRAAEDQPIAPCLGDLKTYQVSHMNSVINTLIAFMGGSDQKIVDQGIALARQQHDLYTIELARVLGLTIEPANATPAATETPKP